MLALKELIYDPLHVHICADLSISSFILPLFPNLLLPFLYTAILAIDKCVIYFLTGCNQVGIEKIFNEIFVLQCCGI